eukprot:CAMPEP_0197081004 /NCGR_PEP_ID=MMETSP1384-20130603/214418_1 /TAXON_ID=29189 /ORGANISM="Ammonia sp." /LENGTH=379 /DNA_ID=CAMNT_0042519895 /DNA_START=84 /DNA_END=1221 /DNA_ORIENTATION=+
MIELNEYYLKSNNTLLILLLAECIPPLLAEYIIFGFNGLTQPVLLAISSTLFFFIVYMVFALVNNIERSRDGKNKSVAYYVEIKLSAQNFDPIANKNYGRYLSKKQTTHIEHAAKRTKSKLTTALIELYGGERYLEVGLVKVLKSSFVLRLVHQVKKKELKDYIIGVKVLKSSFVLRLVHQVKKKELKDYMHRLHEANSPEVRKVVFAHFSELQADRFTVQYHKHFPSLRRLMSSHAQRRLQLSDTRVSFTMDDNYLYRDADGDAAGDVKQEEEDRKEEMDEEEQRLFNHRLQFKKAVNLVTQARQNGTVNDYNQLLFLLREENIGYTVIEDVMKYTRESGLLGGHNESDIDNSSESEMMIPAGIEMLQLTENANENRS